tara:strand:- start:159 stop:809 length:651 start_codon:yes stop_codon:yes gene_type:complete
MLSIFVSITIVVFFFNASARKVLINFLSYFLNILEGEDKDSKKDESESVGKEKLANLIGRTINRLFSVGFVLSYAAFGFGMGEILGTLGTALYNVSYFFILPFGAFISAALPGILYGEVKKKFKLNPTGNIFLTSLLASIVFWWLWSAGWEINATNADFQNAPSEVFIFTGRFDSFDNTVETLGFLITTLISYLIATDSPLLKDKDTEKKEIDPEV